MSIKYFKKAISIAISLALLTIKPVLALSNNPSSFNVEPPHQSVNSSYVSSNDAPLESTRSEVSKSATNTESSYPYPVKCTFEEARKEVEAAGLNISCACKGIP